MSLEHRIGQLEQIEPGVGQCGCFDTRIYDLADDPPVYPQRCPTCNQYQLCVTVNHPGGLLIGFSPTPLEPHSIVKRLGAIHATPEGFTSIY